MKNTFVLSVLAGVLSFSGQSVTMGDADFYMRGMGEDANGDGFVQNTEFRDVLGKMNFASWKWDVSNIGKVYYTNEWAYLPYRGVRRLVHGVYLPQELIMNGDGVTGTGYPNTIKPYAYVFNRITEQNRNFTIHMRFKPDFDQPLGADKSIALFTLGYNKSANKGIRLVANNVTDVETVVWGEGYTGQKVKTRVAAISMSYGQSGWTLSDNCRIGLGVWNDLVFSYTGDKLAVLVCRDGHYFGDKDFRDTAANGYNTRYEEKSDAVNNPRPDINGTMGFGGYNYVNGQVSYPDGATANKLDWTGFRGIVQTIAVWTNGMTEAEMRQVAAYPHPDRWQVGFENDAITEFASASSGAEVNVEVDKWAVPSLGPAQTVSFKFALSVEEDGLAGEYLRVKTTSASPAADLSVTVNGTELAGKACSPGSAVAWFVGKRLLKEGDNAITLRRTDAGTGAVGLDIVRFGGSLQYGKADGKAWEFVAESKALRNFDMVGGDWTSGSRALYGDDTSTTGGRLISNWTYQDVTFRLPGDLLGAEAYRLTWRLAANGGGQCVILMNGTQIGGVNEGTDVQTVVVPTSLVNADGVNVVRVCNKGPSTAASMASIDFIRLSAYDRDGFVLIFK